MLPPPFMVSFRDESVGVRGSRFGQVAINAEQAPTVALLTTWKCELAVSDPAGSMCNATTEGDLQMIQRLLENGVDPDSSDYDERTPFHLAAAEGQQRVVEVSETLFFTVLSCCVVLWTGSLLLGQSAITNELWWVENKEIYFGCIFCVFWRPGRLVSLVWGLFESIRECRLYFI